MAHAGLGPDLWRAGPVASRGAGDPVPGPRRPRPGPPATPSRAPGPSWPNRGEFD